MLKHDFLVFLVTILGLEFILFFFVDSEKKKKKMKTIIVNTNKTDIFLQLLPSSKKNIYIIITTRQNRTRKRRTTSRTDFGIENALLIKIYPEVVTNSVLPIFCYIYIILYYYIKN
jgi:hypothetical protein